MTCHLCVGFCDGATIERRSVSLFDGNDHELEQAMARSRELPDSRTATELRMFLLVELGHILIERKYLELARHSGIDMIAETNWIRVKPVMYDSFLVVRSRELMDALETFTVLKFEGRIRKSGNSGHNTAELFDSGFLLEPLVRAIGLYGGLINGLVLSLRRHHSRDGAVECGRIAVKMLHELGFMPQDYLTVLTLLHSVTESETIDPWITKLPFLDSPST